MQGLADEVLAERKAQVSQETRRYRITATAIVLGILLVVAGITTLALNGQRHAADYQKQVTDRIHACLDKGNTPSECRLAFDVRSPG